MYFSGVINMSSDSARIQRIIDQAPEQIGVHVTCINLLSGIYEFDQSVVIDKPVKIIGNNTRIVATKPDIILFDVLNKATGTTFENISFEGFVQRNESDPPPPYYKLAEHGGTALDIKAGRVVVSRCWFNYFHLAVFLHSIREPASYNNVSVDDFNNIVGNADGFILRDLDIHNCVISIWTLGKDAQVGTVMNSRIQTCRLGVIEQSAFGNSYISNYIDCNQTSEDYGFIIPDHFSTRSNTSTFLCNYLESGTQIQLNPGALVVGGNMSSVAKDGERIGSGNAALTFRSEGSITDSPGVHKEVRYFLHLGGERSFLSNRPNNKYGSIAHFQWAEKDSAGSNYRYDAYSYKVFSYCPAVLAPCEGVTGWNLRNRP